MPKMLRQATEPPKIEVPTYGINVNARVEDIVKNFKDRENAVSDEDSSDEAGSEN